jgi:hypothetical protein
MSKIIVLSTILFFVCAVSTSGVFAQVTNKLDPTGNVGIGTISPSFSIDVNKPAATINLDGRSTGSYGANVHLLGWAGTYPNWKITTANFSNGLDIVPSTTGGGSIFTTPVMTILGSGNIGLGALSPVARLHINTTNGTTIGNDMSMLLTDGNGGIDELTQIGLGYTLSASKPPAVIGLINTSNASFTKGDLFFATRDVATNTAPTERMRITSTGNMGIGSTSPAARLHINTTNGTTIGSNISLLLSDANGGSDELTQIGLGYTLSASKPPAVIGFVNTSNSSFTKGDIFFATRNVATNTAPTEQMRITSEGKVGIGIALPSEKLSVEGNVYASGNISAYGFIKTKKIIVTQTAWPDYVFATDYNLRSLSSLEAFIKENKHLPEVPSAKDVEEKGISVGDNQALLLRKIEELTLYVINQQKQIDGQAKQIMQLKSKK